jgi:hypothetical protein
MREGLPLCHGPQKQATPALRKAIAESLTPFTAQGSKVNLFLPGEKRNGHSHFG